MDECPPFEPFSRQMGIQNSALQAIDVLELLAD